MAIEINCDCKCCGCEASTWKKIVRACNIISGLLLISLGILRFVFISQASTFLDIILSIYYILFGVIIALSEFGVEFILKYFSFQEGYIGRGVFIILYNFFELALVFCASIISNSHIRLDNSEEENKPAHLEEHQVQNYQDIRKV